MSMWDPQELHAGGREAAISGTDAMPPPVRATRAYGVLGLLVLFVFGFVTGCTSWERGLDPTGRELRSQAEDRIIPSIVAFKDRTNRYPESLDDIGAELGWLPEDAHVQYGRVGDDGFFVTLSYTPSWPSPGRTTCHYSSANGAWSCAGYL